MTQILFDDDIFSQNLKYLRKKNRLSQKELALRSGINVFWIRGLKMGVIGLRFLLQIIGSFVKH